MAGNPGSQGVYRYLGIDDDRGRQQAGIALVPRPEECWLDTPPAD